MHIRPVSKRDHFNAGHLELDFGGDLIVATNNKVKLNRTLTLPQTKRLVAGAPSFLARGGSSK